jgi:asparagine synthase (glutamine-hydrolysing)
MCGICGIIHLKGQPVTREPIEFMMNAMKHRGPDADGVFLSDNIGLGFVRLSILDLSPAGNQPMYSEDGSHVLIFNGEVFNYLELRKELEDIGHHFSTQTDTEVVLAAYREWGADCQEHFTGMWAFAVYNKNDSSVFISRDRFGIKPFYYHLDENAFIFASEIEPLLLVSDALRTPNDAIIFDYLISNRTNHTSQTFFKGIEKLQHGHFIRIRNNKISGPVRWYNLSTNTAAGYKGPEEFKNDFIRSLRMQLRSDVPIGVCLSGGIDSSSIAASICRNFGRNDIHSFSAVYGKGVTGDESTYIDELDGYIDNIHFTHPTLTSFLSDLDLFVSAQQEPVSSTSGYAEFKVMELAGLNNCTVLLNGQGVDEYLAGYHYFVGFLFKQRVHELKWIDAFNVLRGYFQKHRSFLALKFGAFLVLPPKIKTSLLVNKNNFVSKDFFTRHASVASNVLINKLYGSKTLRESFINHFEHKFEHHLLWADKSGMKFSLETRFPFLDHLIVEKMLNTATDMIYKDGITKIILREAMKGVVPEKVRTRMDKVGYSTPEDIWFRDVRFQELFRDIISSSGFRSRAYFNLKKIQTLFEDHTANRRNNSQKIWKILNLELWFRKFIDK